MKQVLGKLGHLDSFSNYGPFGSSSAERLQQACLQCKLSFERPFPLVLKRDVIQYAASRYLCSSRPCSVLSTTFVEVADTKIMYGCAYGDKFAKRRLYCDDITGRRISDR
jgi:hypothetical protein